MNAITQAEEPGSLLNLIARAASDPAVDVAKMEALLAMQERVLKAQAKHDFNSAMARVAAELEPVKRDAQNPHMGNRYARLETIDTALRPIYSANGFSVRYGSEEAPAGSVRITCTVAHTGGHSETLGLTAPIDAMSGGRQARTGVQAIGSSVTYLRRYLITMAFNVTLSDDDDDGEAGRPRRPPAPRREEEQADPEVEALENARRFTAQAAEQFRRAATQAAIAAVERNYARHTARLRIAYPELAAQFDEAKLQAEERVAMQGDPVEAAAERGADLLSGG